VIDVHTHGTVILCALQVIIKFRHPTRSTTSIRFPRSASLKDSHRRTRYTLHCARTLMTSAPHYRHNSVWCVRRGSQSDHDLTKVHSNIGP